MSQLNIRLIPACGVGLIVNSQSSPLHLTIQPNQSEQTLSRRGSVVQASTSVASSTPKNVWMATLWLQFERFGAICFSQERVLESHWKHWATGNTATRAPVSACFQLWGWLCVACMEFFFFFFYCIMAILQSTAVRSHLPGWDCDVILSTYCKNSMDWSAEWSLTDLCIFCYSCGRF